MKAGMAHDASATDLLNARIESGVAAMRDAKRTGNDDVALAERHLRGLLQTVKSRAMLSSSGETVVVAEGLKSVFPSNKWWPF